MSQEITEGYIDFDYPKAGKPCKTWFRALGDISPDSGKTPLVCLHGGPGWSPLYIKPLEDLYYKYNIPLVFYNQLGSAKSTHLPERMGDEDFWTEKLFLEELDNVVDKLQLRGRFHLYGQSWGGMLGSAYAAQKPSGLRKLILANSPASMQLWAEGCAQLFALLPKHVQDTITKHEQAGTTDSDEYEAACMVFYRENSCRVGDPLPLEFLEDMGELKKDPTVYHTMNGPSEFCVTGNLKYWSMESRTENIDAQTLVINGKYDMARDFAVKPFVDGIKNAKWIRYEDSSHMPHFEEREKYMQDLFEFLQE